MALNEKELEARAAHHILVATDFSENARTALDWAVGVALAGGSRITLVHAIESFERSNVPLTLQDDVARNLESLKSSAQDRGVEVGVMSRAGRAWEVIADVEAETKADLIVMGTRGRTPVGRLILGSTADRVIRIACAPVLTIPAESARPAGSIRTVLVPTDFSKESARAMDAAAQLLRPAGEAGRMILLHVAHLPATHEPLAMGSLLAEQFTTASAFGQQQIREVAKQVRDESFELDLVVRDGYPAMVIRDEAEANDVDVIAMGTHGRAGVRRFFLGSVAERVLHNAGCPILTVRHCATEKAVQRSA